MSSKFCWNVHDSVIHLGLVLPQSLKAAFTLYSNIITSYHSCCIYCKINYKRVSEETHYKDWAGEKGPNRTVLSILQNMKLCMDK